MFQPIDLDTMDLLAPAPEGEPLRQYYFIPNAYTFQVF